MANRKVLQKKMIKDPPAVLALTLLTNESNGCPFSCGGFCPLFGDALISFEASYLKILQNSFCNVKKLAFFHSIFEVTCRFDEDFTASVIWLEYLLSKSQTCMRINVFWWVRVLMIYTVYAWWQSYCLRWQELLLVFYNFIEMIS